MMPRSARSAVVCLLAPLVAGCAVFVLPVGRAIPIGLTPTPPVPVIRLVYAGQTVTSVESSATWRNGAGSYSGGSATQPGTPLALPAGATVDLVITGAAPPPILWIAELDAQGVPVHASVLQPVSGAMRYTPAGAGRFRLQVTAEWGYQNMVTHIFEVEVQP